ncbi:hypothetical protein [Neobacillus massiliamazoniensis]|uniref:Uncharacterized protein n=1 Tax=Neobacillus massiliamazoniensis TaxID=1499688 RepID=A0A0U1NQL3_9BACI|nr:hypothetical protein [Neobacillus massiliamazoniensis]CRK80324.1 hypothetical protein BN000_00205 [Neobacillus massiliamazoniensis]
MSKSELIEKLKKDLLDTGFPLELSISNTLKRNGWGVIHNSYYIDRDDQKGREIDLIARTFQYKEIDEEKFQEIAFSLIIEIKKAVKKPWVIFTTEKRGLLEDFYRLKYVSSGFNIETYRLNEVLFSNGPKVNETLGRNFYEGFSGNGARDDIYKALTGTVKALEHFKEVSVYKTEAAGRLMEIFESLVIIEGKLYEAFLDEDGELQVEERQYIQSTFNYLSPNYNTGDGNIVSIITIDYLKDLLLDRRNRLEDIFRGYLKM